MLAMMAPQKEVFLEWGRGTGKSTELAWHMSEMSTTMPRGRFTLLGPTFRSILENTLPSTIAGLELFGIYKDIHYFVGRRAPKAFGWPEPYQPPLRYDHCIHFISGAVWQMQSQDPGSGSGRGSNVDGGIGDEAALLDEDRTFNEFQANNRTKRRLFQNVPLYHAEIFASTTPMTKAGMWFLKGEAQAIENPKQTAFISASALHNKANLEDGWFERMKKKAPTPMHYKAEILNIRPRQVEHGFYHMLDPKRHYVSQSNRDHYIGMVRNFKPTSINCLGDLDHDPTLPLIVTFDPGVYINAGVVMQKHGRNLRCLKELWRIEERTQDMFIKEFIPYYSHHIAKRIDLYYDRVAGNRQQNSRHSIAEEIARLLRQHGWAVTLKCQGISTIYHADKHHTINAVLAGDDPRLPYVTINQDNCPNLIVSLEQAPAIEDRRGLPKKDKRSEQRKGAGPRQHATDLSDAFDIPIHMLAKPAMRHRTEHHGIHSL